MLDDGSSSNAVAVTPEVVVADPVLVNSARVRPGVVGGGV